MLKIAGALALLVAAVPAGAQTVTFDDFASSGNPILTSATSGGYQFTGSHFHSIDDPATPGLVGNGTHYLASEIDGVTMTKVGGGTFSLNQADIAELFLQGDNSFQLVFTGNVSGGGTLSSVFTLDQIKDGNGGVADFQTVSFAGWNNLLSVGITGRNAAGAFGNYSVDNIVTNATGGVPEPATWAMMILGMGGIGSTLRRRRSTVAFA